MYYQLCNPSPTQEQQCVTTCCMRCEEVDNCDLCNQLFKYDPETCPCVEDLNLSEDQLAKGGPRIDHT